MPFERGPGGRRRIVCVLSVVLCLVSEFPLNQQCEVGRTLGAVTRSPGQFDRLLSQLDVAQCSAANMNAASLL